MPIDLTPFAEAINSALAEGTFCVLATAGEQGPDIGFKGSMQVFDREHATGNERAAGIWRTCDRTRALPSCISAGSAASI
jgi:hypothetical protein